MRKAERERAAKRSRAAKKGWRTRRANERKRAAFEKSYQARERAAIQWEERGTVRASRDWARHVPTDGFIDTYDPNYRHQGGPPGRAPAVDPDYMEALAERLDLDVSDLYDMYYGYPPGSHGRA